MAQQLSPWLEGAYGWNFGESNWNTGIDQNQLKFSFMFDRNVEGVVASLPAAVNGQAYFLTTDNRLYFAVGTTWFSSPTPKWFEFVIRSSGTTYQFNGTSAVQIDTPMELDARIDAVEVTISSLGTAAFEDVETFATQAALDIVEGSAQAYADGVGVAANDYTDVLRQDLADPSGVENGSAMVARSAQFVQSIAGLRALLKTSASANAFVTGYYAGGDGGGGAYYLDAADITSADNGGTIIVAADGGRWKLVSTGVISIKQFGAAGDDVTDDTAAIQAAIDYVGSVGGGTVFFPEGFYRVSSAINISSQAVILRGESRFATLIKQVMLNTRCLEITSNFCGVNGLSIMYDGTPATGGTAIYCEGDYCTFDDFAIRSAYIAFEYKTGVAGKITNFELLDYENIGLFVHELNDLFVARFIMNAGNTTKGVLGGIRLQDKVEAFICCDGDILLGQCSMTSDAVVYAPSTRPAYNNFTNVFFDSAANTTQITKMVETEFVGCWFSGGREGSGSSGASISDSQSIRFTNSRFFNNGGHGCLLVATATDVTFTACKFESNSVSAGAGVAHGLFLGDGSTQFQVIGCTASNGLHSGQQGYGVLVGTGCDNFVIRDNNVLGNLTGPVNDASADTADKTIHGNIGYRTTNNGIGTISSGTTSVVVNHGLAVTPRLQDIKLTRGSTNAGSTDLFASGITSTQFTIQTAPAPSSNINIAWEARAKGA